MKTNKRNYSLNSKMVAYFFILAGIILLLTQVVFNFSLDQHLVRYLKEREEDVNRQIAQSFLSYYQDELGWAGCQKIGHHTAVSTNTHLVLIDTSENIVFDSRAPGMGMMGRRHTQEDLSIPIEPEDFHYTLPMEYEGEEIGTLFIAYPNREEGVLQRQDQIFRHVLGRSLLWTGLLAAFLAFGLSLLFSRRLSGPLKTMAKAAARIGKGELSVRLPGYDTFELQKLSASFNTMAKKLETMEALRRRSTADLSHELRTPLTTLKSYFEAFNDGVMVPDRETINTLNEEVVQLGRLVDELDELSRAEQITGDDLKKEQISLNRFLKEKAAFFQPLVQNKNQKLELLLPDTEVTVFQDPSSLARIIGNLLSNACKYTPSEGLITVELRETPVRREYRPGVWGSSIIAENQEHEYIVVSIKDSGVGIKETDLPYIFERFFRADPSRERSRGGAGIGLALVKELVRAGGGAIYVESAWEEGTMFELYLPRTYS